MPTNSFAKLNASAKRVYLFGAGRADGNADMKDLLGGKGANLAEMASLGLPVPPGFTITTEMCNVYTANGGALPDGLKGDAEAALAEVRSELRLPFRGGQDDEVVGLDVRRRGCQAEEVQQLIDVSMNRAHRDFEAVCQFARAHAAARLQQQEDRQQTARQHVCGFRKYMTSDYILSAR